jgi:molecular chaperone Hsp33
MTDLSADADVIRRYLCEQVPGARVISARLTETAHALVAHQQMPAQVAALCQEMSVAASLLTNCLKFEGEMILQAKSDGPVNLLVAECTSDGQLRTTAQWDPAIRATNFRDMMGEGYFAVTVDPKHGERYQGIVTLDAESIAACMNQYFRQSEQLDTEIWLAADGTTAGGLLIQRLASEGGHGQTTSDGLETLKTLARTVLNEELITDAGPKLVYRLFHELNPRQFEPWPVHFGCSCSKARSARAIRAQVYEYDQADLEWLLSDQPPRSDTLQ